MVSVTCLPPLHQDQIQSILFSKLLWYYCYYRKVKLIRRMSSLIKDKFTYKLQLLHILHNLINNSDRLILSKMLKCYHSNIPRCSVFSDFFSLHQVCLEIFQMVCWSDRYRNTNNVLTFRLLGLRLEYYDGKR